MKFLKVDFNDPFDKLRAFSYDPVEPDEVVWAWTDDDDPWFRYQARVLECRPTADRVRSIDRGYRYLVVMEGIEGTREEARWHK